MTNWKWTKASQKAAKLVAAGDLSYEEIAAECSIGRATVARWAKTPQFEARVKRLVDEYAKAVRRRGIAILERRVAALDDRWDRMKRLMDARSADPGMKGVPGGDTGIVVRDLKGIGKGDDFQVVETFAFDAALFREFREHEKQAAQELGQWTERQHVEHRDLGADEAFDRRMGELAARTEPGGVPGGPDAG